MKAYVIRTDPSVSKDVFASLKAGKARIGWSYRDDLDLRSLKAANDEGRWEEKKDDAWDDAWGCIRFLTEVEPGDVALYANHPEQGYFGVAKITGSYDYASPNDGLGEQNADFRSYRPCDLLTPEPVAVTDAIVSPTLRRKLGLRGRLYRIYEIELVENLIAKLSQAGSPEEPGSRMERVLKKLLEDVPNRLQEEYPAADLSRIFCKDLFERMGYAVDLREGAGDHGSDLVVTISDELLPRDFKVGVQVFSYKGEVGIQELTRKLHQLLDGWKDNALDLGALLTTGSCGPEGRRIVAEHSRANPNRPVKLIDGPDFARLVLRNLHNLKLSSLDAAGN